MVLPWLASGAAVFSESKRPACYAQECQKHVLCTQLSAAGCTPFGAGGAGHGLASANQLNAQQECAAFFTYIGLTVGVLLPLWLLVKTEPSSSLAKWEAAQQRAASSSNGQVVPLHSRLCTSLEAALRALCGPSWLTSSSRQPRHLQQGWQLEGWQRLLLWWQLLSLAWLCSVALASP